MFSGEVLYTFTNAKLEGSYDYKIRIALNDYEFEKVDGVMVPQKLLTNNHLVVECSLHKLFLSHNVAWGPIDIKKSIKHLVNFIEESMQINLPYYDKWEVKKVDVSKIFVMPTKEIALKLMMSFIGVAT